VETEKAGGGGEEAQGLGHGGGGDLHAGAAVGLGSRMMRIEEFYPELRVCGVEEVGLRARFGRIFFRFNHAVGLVRSNPYSLIVVLLRTNFAPCPFQDP
jgi:hypothetical protein